MKITLTDFLPQGEEITSLSRQIAGQRLVHALLITGEEGLGKKTLARLIAGALLCRAPGERPCGSCRDCLMAEKLEHPDLILISRQGPEGTEKGGKERASIPVDDIREAVRACGVKTLDSGNRVVLIFEADKMTPQAQNCLLKTLEEPPEDTYFILVSEHTESLLTTVISRCRPVRLHPWEDAVVKRVLTERGIPADRAAQVLPAAAGSIGKAIRLAGDEEYWQRRGEVIKAFFATVRRSDILSISTAWKDRKSEAEDFWQILELQVRQLLLRHLGNKDAQLTAGMPQAWVRFADQAPPERFAALLDAVAEARKQTLASVNFQAVVEQLLLIFMGESNQWQT